MTPAADLICSFEGCKLVAYLDTRGRWTVGWGCTGKMRDGRVIGPGLVITQAEADAEFEHRLVPLEDIVRHACPRATLNQHVAMCSFAWNEGTSGFLKSFIVSRLNAGDVQGAADDFFQYERAGADAHILHNRRVAERAVFLKDVVHPTCS